MIEFPCKFGDEYPVRQRERFVGTHLKHTYYRFSNAVVRGIKITREGTEVTLLVPPGIEVVDADPASKRD
jgi:hypothetical protein